MRQQTFRAIAAVAALLTIGMTGTAEAQRGWFDTADAYAGTLGEAFGFDEEWMTGNRGRASRDRNAWNAWCAGYGNQRDRYDNQRQTAYGFEFPRYDDRGRRTSRNGRYGPQQRYRENNWGSAPNRRNTRSWNDRENECRAYKQEMRSYDQRRYEQQRRARRPTYNNNVRRTTAPRTNRSAVRRPIGAQREVGRPHGGEAPTRRAVKRPEPAGPAKAQAPETPTAGTGARQRARWMGALPMGAGAAAAQPRNRRQ